jgi:hypothetical protein
MNAPTQLPLVIDRPVPADVGAEVGRDVHADVGPRDFDWQRDEGDIVIPYQPRTAVYENTCGTIVIRQENYSDDDDVVVLVTPENLPALIAALQAFALPPGRRS